MLTLYTWKTPNGYKVPILLEELGLEYEIKPVNIMADEQMTPKYLAINPNNKIPALVDHDAPGGPLSIFESGAILMYLAEKAGTFFPQDERGKYLVTEWLMFQVGGVGPMYGQAGHYVKFAKEKVPYSIDRYKAEVARLSRVMDRRLGEAKFFAGEYSIADMCAWPWVRAGVEYGYGLLDDYSNLKRWFDEVGEREAVKRALKKTDDAVEAHKKAHPAA